MIYFILLTGNVKDSVFLLVLWLTIAIKCTVWTTDKQKKNFIARYAACSSIQDITVLAPTIDYIWMIYLKSRESIAYCQTLISSGGAQLSFISWAHFVQYKTFLKKTLLIAPQGHNKYYTTAIYIAWASNRRQVSMVQEIKQSCFFVHKFIHPQQKNICLQKFQRVITLEENKS